jgi:peptidoglycan/xylan/chitin deacetylase (PgdA/CDA1 family)
MKRAGVVLWMISLIASTLVVATPSIARAEQLVANGSFEVVSGGLPVSWVSGSWGSHSAVLSVPSSGGHTGSGFGRVEMSSRSSGDSKWAFDHVPVTAGTTYTFSDWYRSDVTTSLVVQVASTSGGFSYTWLGDVGSSPAWTQATATWTAPANAVSVSVFHLIARNGFLDIDDVSLASGSGGPGGGLDRALLSFTFDDGWESQASVAGPMLDARGYDATFYINSGFLDSGPYMSTAQLLGLHGNGHEIASHTVSHEHLTQLPLVQLRAQLQDDRAALEAIIGEPVPNFATPFGEFNPQVLAEIQAVFSSHRSVFESLNTVDSTDVYELHVRNILNTTSTAAVEGWIAEAQAADAWLILVYHNIVSSPDTYDTTPTRLGQHLDAADAAGIAVVTVADALAEVLPQLS